MKIREQSFSLKSCGILITRTRTSLVEDQSPLSLDKTDKSPATRGWRHWPRKVEAKVDFVTMPVVQGQNTQHKCLYISKSHRE